MVLCIFSQKLRRRAVTRNESMSASTTKSSGKHDESQEDPQLMTDSAANDLRELHQSATFLTPYAVAPEGDKHVWLSNSQEEYVDPTEQSTSTSSHD